ncbi:MAG: hypothetical protein SF097_03255 [Acidobacteriota bacterium]|nr:hypothetical protein [Acidobacteriota bacterium]
MTRSIKLLFGLALVVASALLAFGQTPQPAPQTSACPLLKTNPKIALPDFEAAKAETLASGGEQAELIYAARIDAVTRGAYDSLIVVYAKPAKTGQDYFALILREGQKLPLIADKKDKLARAFPAGDKYLRMGLRHEEGKAPLIRLMAATNDKEKGEQQRNLDFQFNGSEFVLVAESVMPLPK